jgi:hypothetical protein
MPEGKHGKTPSDDPTPITTMKNPPPFLISLVILSQACAGQEPATNGAPKPEAGKVTAHSDGLHGYIGFGHEPLPSRSRD